MYNARMKRPTPVPALLAAALLNASCATTVRIPEGGLGGPLSDAESVFARAGPETVSVEAGWREGGYGCRTAYEVYRPARGGSGVLVVLAHGFGRDLASMRGWARHWATHGVAAVVASFCNSTWAAGNHDRNAEDLAALAHALHDGPVLYAGFSAGGLAAFLAAASDPRALAYLGLDAVDSGGLAPPAAARFAAPALFLLGEPSACNAQGNFLPSIPEHATALRIRGATHGHFEDPYDPAVELVCGRVEPPEASARIAAAIRALATAWILDRCAPSPDAARLLEAAAADGPWAARVERVR